MDSLQRNGSTMRHGKRRWRIHPACAGGHALDGARSAELDWLNAGLLIAGSASTVSKPHLAGLNTRFFAHTRSASPGNPDPSRPSPMSWCPKMRGCRKNRFPCTFSQPACLKLQGCRSQTGPVCPEMRVCRRILSKNAGLSKNTERLAFDIPAFWDMGGHFPCKAGLVFDNPAVQDERVQNRP
jgi:hypothetical protein